MNRRLISALIIVLLGMALGLSYCSQQGKTASVDNVSFSQKMVDLLGWQPGMSRKDFEMLLVDRTFGQGATWKKNTDAGTVKTASGQEVLIRFTETGQAFTVGLSAPAMVAFPDPMKAGKVEQLSVDAGNGAWIVIYGTSSTTGYFMDKQEALKQFATEYTSDFDAPLRVIHLNFCPPGTSVPFADVNGSGIIHPQQGNQVPAYSVPYGKDGQLVQQHVYINLNFAHQVARAFGMDMQTVVEGLLANEAANTLARQQDPTYWTAEANQAASTAAEFASWHNEPFRQMILGGSAYAAVMESVAIEVERLVKIANR